MDPNPEWRGGRDGLGSGSGSWQQQQGEGGLSSGMEAGAGGGGAEAARQRGGQLGVGAGAAATGGTPTLDRTAQQVGVCVVGGGESGLQEDRGASGTCYCQPTK